MKSTRFHRALRIFLAGYTLLVGGLFAGSCLFLYITGSTPVNHPAPGVYIVPLFSRGTVAALLGRFAPLLWGYLTALGLAFILLPAISPLSKGTVHERMQPLCPKKQQLSRLVLLMLAVCLIVYGMIQGGLRDVLVKAINICTECIGLG